LIESPNDPRAQIYERGRAKSLGDAFVTTVLDRLRARDVKRVVVVPEEILSDVPLAAFVDEKGRREIETRSISEVASFNDLLVSVPPRRSPKALCVAYPSGVGSRHANRQTGGDLPNAAKEVAAIRKRFRDANILLNSRATIASVLRKWQTFQILHFAVHGITDRRNGLECALELCPDPSKPDDGLFKAVEIANHHLAAQLTVLSSCVSATGQPQLYEGVVGLAWAFRAAGCPTVVASRWRVDDRAAYLLMDDFYEQLAHGLRKDVALRHAMRQVLNRPAYQSPAYWAAFQVLGPCDPVVASR
jgi:CHAT domain-containing protein